MGVAKKKEVHSVRVSTHGYLTAVFIGTFFTAFLLYSELDVLALAVFIVSWVCIPFFAFNDRIVFDGRRLERTGVVPRWWARLTRTRSTLRLKDVESVETLAVRTVKRGSTVTYRYRTSFTGRGLCVSIASGSGKFREMVRSVLSLLPEAALDIRSIELRDHLTDPKEVIMRAEFAGIPGDEVLEEMLRQKGRRTGTISTLAEEEKFDDLRSLANELRIAGSLLRSLEAFRRALLLRPTDATLLFEFARCLHSLALARRDNSLERRALAAVRLAGRRADSDDLLARIAEWYFQLGEWGKAGDLFRAVRERAGRDYRSARALAELSLREGKIAYVIQNFYAAMRASDVPSLRRWSRGEAEYFSQLNSNDDYMGREISRVNMLVASEGLRRTSSRIILFSLPLIIVGVTFEDETVTNLGWAVAAISIAAWTGFVAANRFLSPRHPYPRSD